MQILPIPCTYGTLPWQPFFDFLYSIEGSHWRHLANTTELSMYRSDAALCQITLTTCFLLVPVLLLLLFKLVEIKRYLSLFDAWCWYFQGIKRDLMSVWKIFDVKLLCHFTAFKNHVRSFISGVKCSKKKYLWCSWRRHEAVSVLGYSAKEMNICDNFVLTPITVVIKTWIFSLRYFHLQ